MKEEISWCLFCGFMLSLIMFFFNWKIACTGIACMIILSKLASLFCSELALTTVRQLTEKIVRENYRAFRRNKATINKHEILKLTSDFLTTNLGLDQSLLTKDALLFEPSGNS